MRQRNFKNLFLLGVLALALLAPGWAQATITFTRIVVFGGSVSDPGNAFALKGFANRPPYDQLDPFLIPSGPYSVGGNHFSNGATWIEQFARPLGLGGEVRPAFASSSLDATNYAVGGARAREENLNVDMPEQISTFLRDFNNVADPDALYVIDFGGNDVRDALFALPDFNQANLILQQALTSLASNIGMLIQAGARKFLILNVADIGQIPSILILNSQIPGIAQVATLFSEEFNGGVDTFLGTLSGVEIAKLDIFGTVDSLIANAKEFGLTNVTGACIKPNVPPFTCQTPDQFLFWDGIHPTKAIHAIFAQEAADVLK